ncbi:Glycosyl transferase family 2 [Sterolibacterium denitrificans]|uniref:Glycosyl transferase family 2 n=1 Tax=Sterolibacterium denitrificans TaxID=157592 RepID=A0A7Z7HQ57_9PROT|nr:glycosyltransferase family 2 protein [Sterolibacterium denitrificans]SMB23853.1 Glycosyl transferase family 2 [Sterolibacterium denitrificans]
MPVLQKISTEDVNAPLITVIVAVYDGAATLQRCLDSVALQTYPHRELIIVDGGSQDGTVDLLGNNGKKIKWWISEPDKGIYDAWNKGLAQAKGEWICFLGADDYFWGADVLERMAGRLSALPADVNVAYGQVMLLGLEGQSLYAVGKPWPEIRERFQQVMCIPHPGAMHRRRLFERHGVFDPSFHISGDYELLLRELGSGGEAVFLPGIITAGMAQDGVSSHPQNSWISLNETRRAQKMHGLPFAGWIWLMEMSRLYIRYSIWKLFGEYRARRLLDLGRRLRGLPPYWTRT